MREATLVYPHQLFSRSDALKKGRMVILREDSLFFDDQEYPISFHQQKLVLHRASMKHYELELKERGYSVSYLELGKSLPKSLKSLHVVDVTDDVLRRRLKASCEQEGIELNWYPNPNFLAPMPVYDEYFDQNPKYFLTNFYRWQRQRLDILVDSKGKPKGGQWTYDSENRKKAPKDLECPDIPAVRRDEITEKAIAWVKKTFPTNPGDAEDFAYPVKRSQARYWLEDFLEARLKQFGPYQDAMTEQDIFLFHSVLTPSLNIGLINADEVIEKTLTFAKEHQIPMNSLEGFLRQVMGWREFMRAIYEREGSQVRTQNYWKHHRKIPTSFWTGETGLIPVDTVIKRTLKHAYAHHIERLMVLGNIMLLCEFHPDEVYRWFMTFFIDAYDWVMVPNVYSMSQYADGGLITTKPYVSSSNYLRKMARFERGDWEQTWDGLYWRFIDKHRQTFANNPRMSMMIRQLEAMDKAKLKQHHQQAEAFLKTLRS